MTSSSSLVLVLAVVAALPQASPPPEMVRVKETAYARVRLAQQLAADPAIVKAIEASNARGESLASVQAKDAAWIKDPAFPLRKQIVQAPCSQRLKELVAPDSMVVEAFAMDERGALVCTIAETSDYWQGDEPKWQKTYVEGKAAYVDEPAFDQSSATLAIQVSVPAVQGGHRIGALTLTLKLNLQVVPAR